MVTRCPTGSGMRQIVSDRFVELLLAGFDDASNLLGVAFTFLPQFCNRL